MKIIRFFAATCLRCKGSGTRIYSEFMPPFQKFTGKCDECNGLCVTFDKDKPIDIKEF